MSRKYNHKLYGLFQKAGSIVRNKCSPDFAGIFGKVFGFLGKVIAFIFTHLIAKPLHFLAFAIVGLFYNKHSDSPYKGSILYTITSILLTFMLAEILQSLL